MDNSPDKVSARSPSSQKQEGVNRGPAEKVNDLFKMFSSLVSPTRNCQADEAIPYRVSCKGSKLEQGSSTSAGGLAILDVIEPLRLDSDSSCPTQSHFEIVSGAVDPNVPIVAAYDVGVAGSSVSVSNKGASGY